jgi:UDP-N-acetylmuramoyl-tripeptide--D-alanyl-D-alanine ligase
MITVGRLFRQRRLHNKNSVFSTLLYIADHFGVRLFLFSSADVDFESKTINALFMEEGKQLRKRTPFPHLVDNSHSFGSRTLRHALTEAGVILVQPFSKPSKMRTYNLISKNKRFSELLIPHFLLDKPESLEEYLRKFDRQIVIKPENGRGGVGVTKISKENGMYCTTSWKNKSETLLENEWNAYCDALFAGGKKYIVQPYIKSRTKSGAPFDIRIHARRGKSGEFVVLYAPRIGNPAGIVSNMHTGGYTMPIDTFLALEWGETWEEVRAGLNEIGDTFPEYYQSFFATTTSAVALDIGIERTAEGGFRFRLFEVNAYPLSFSAVTEDAVTLIEYYRWLYEKHGLQDRHI